MGVGVLATCVSVYHVHDWLWKPDRESDPWNFVEAASWMMGNKPQSSGWVPTVLDSWNISPTQMVSSSMGHWKEKFADFESKVHKLENILKITLVFFIGPTTWELSQSQWLGFNYRHFKFWQKCHLMSVSSFLLNHGSINITTIVVIKNLNRIIFSKEGLEIKQQVQLSVFLLNLNSYWCGIDVFHKAVFWFQGLSIGTLKRTKEISPNLLLDFCSM